MFLSHKLLTPVHQAHNLILISISYLLWFDPFSSFLTILPYLISESSQKLSPIIISKNSNYSFFNSITMFQETNDSAETSKLNMVRSRSVPYRTEYAAAAALKSARSPLPPSPLPTIGNGRFNSYH